jgi:hypothetical protein
MKRKSPDDMGRSKPFLSRDTLLAETIGLTLEYNRTHNYEYGDMRMFYYAKTLDTEGIFRFNKQLEEAIKST